jgi:hypothetical protein
MVALSALTILAVQTVSLAWSASRLNKTDVVIFALHAAVALYAVILSVISVPQNTVPPHSYSVVHLCIVTFTACFLLGTTAILPGTYHITAPFDDPLKVIWYAVLGLYIVSFVVTITTPLGPPLHYPVSRIYDEKTVSQITNKTTDNVCGVVGASIWSFLLFS